jgi:hypothetical protein
LITVAAFMALIAAAYAVMPGLDEVPATFPATTLWRFRIASVATQLALWTALAVIFGALVERGWAMPAV